MMMCRRVVVRAAGSGDGISCRKKNLPAFFVDFLHLGYEFVEVLEVLVD